MILGSLLGQTRPKLFSAGSTLGPLLTQVHVSGPGVALLVAFAASQLHELHVQLIEDIPVQRVHCVHQLVGKGGR